MADEPAPTPPTPTPLPNDPASRTPDGTIKDVATPTPTPTPEDPKSPPTEKSTTPDPTLAAKDPPKDPAKAEPAVVPEKYELKAPEGFEVDPDFIDKATPVLKELGITNEGAQKLFDIVQGKVTNAKSEIIDAYETMRDGWRKEMVADKELGNGKDDLAPAVKQNIAAAINFLPAELQTPFKDAMNLTGAGDNPAFVKALNHLGKQFREGTPVTPGKPSPLGQKPPGAGPKSAAAAIYPNLPTSSGA